MLQQQVQAVVERGAAKGVEEVVVVMAMAEEESKDFAHIFVKKER